MKKLMLLLCLFIFASFLFAETITWTGAAGDGDWFNPANWEPPRVPTMTDDVVIPEGGIIQLRNGRHVVINSLVNNGNVEVDDTGDRITFVETQGNFENNGEFSSEDDLHLTGRDFFNNGDFRSGARLDLLFRNFRNNPGARIVVVRGLFAPVAIDLNQVEIVARQLAINFGEIWGEDSELEDVPGPGIGIDCYEFQNFNLIKTGDGGPNADGGDLRIHGDYVSNRGRIEVGDGGSHGDGGGVEIYAKWLFENYGSMFSGDAGYGGEAGDMWIISTHVDNWGQIQGGYSRKESATTLDFIDNEIYLVGDSVKIHPGDSSIITPMHFFTIGRNILVYDINSAGGLRAGFRGSFITPPDGVLDFSGVTVENAINCNPGDIWLKTDSIIAPPGGLDFIMTPPPMTTGPDTTIVNGFITSRNAISDTGNTDTIKVNVQNLSTANKTLIYSITSVLGWVTPATGMFFGVAPFTTDSLNVVFNIPTDAYEGETDTVMAVLSIDPDFTETTYSLITVSNGVLHLIDALLVEPVDLNMDSKVISACDSQCIHWHLDVPEESIVENAVLRIDTTTYTLESPEVNLLGDDLFYCSTIPWVEGDSVEFCLTSVWGTLGAYLEEPVCGWMKFDFSPPIIDSLEPSPGITVPATGVWISFSITGSVCWPLAWDGWVGSPGGLDASIPYIPYFLESLIPGDTVEICVHVIEGCYADYCSTAIRSDTCWTFYVEAPLFTFEYDIPIGWNLLSYPYADEVLLSETFAFFTPPGYGYDPESAAYFPTDTVTAGWGFWLMSPFDTMAIVTSTSEIDTIDYIFYPGWNIFGSPAFPVPSIKFEEFPEVLLPTFGYDPLLRSYFIADTLYPGFGYWILSLDTLEFVLPE